MRTTAISELKARLSEHLAWVKRGEEVLVTERGKPVARIVPVGPETTDNERLRAWAARGVLRPGKRQSASLVRGLPVCSLPEGVLQQALDEERRDRV